MNSASFELNKLKRKGTFPWWTIMAITGLFILLFLLRTCVTGHNVFGNNNSTQIIVDDPEYPENPNRLLPIDTTKILVPDDPLKREIISNLINVYLDDTVDLQPFGSRVIRKYTSDSIRVTYFAEEYKRLQFMVPPDRRVSLIEEIKADFVQVKFACFEAIYTQSFKGSDPAFADINKNWFYDAIGLYKAWDITQGNSNVKIAVIDDSFDKNHSELSSQIVTEWNVSNYSPNITTYNGKLIHGTHVAGTIAGIEGNNLGLSGVAPKCQIVPIQIADNSGMMTTSSILDGIFYALKNKVSIINMSIGMSSIEIGEELSISEQEQLSKTLYADEAEMWDEVFKIAEDEGVIIVQAAGNSNIVAALDPMKRSNHCLIVGATNKTGQKADFSNFGDKVTVFAPGVDIYSCLPNGKYDFLSGTSMASPIVAGCVALMLSIKKDLTLTQIKQILKNTGLSVLNQNAKLIQIDQVLNQL